MAREDVEGRADARRRCFVPSPADLLQLPESLMPVETRRHVRAARREFLLAIRSWIDAMLAELEEEERAEARRRPVRIQIR